MLWNDIFHRLFNNFNTIEMQLTCNCAASLFIFPLTEEKEVKFLKFTFETN